MKKKITLKSMVSNLVKEAGKGNTCMGTLHEGRVYLSTNTCMMVGFDIREPGFNEDLLKSLNLMKWGDSGLVDCVNSAKEVDVDYDYKGYFNARVDGKRTVLILESGGVTCHIDKKFLDVLGDDYWQYTYKISPTMLCVYSGEVLEAFILGIRFNKGS